jgi:hypothetical protein
MPALRPQQEPANCSGSSSSGSSSRCEHVCCPEAIFVAHVKRVERITPQVAGQRYIRSKSLQAAATAAAAAADVSMSAVLKPFSWLMSNVLTASCHKSQASTTSAARACKQQQQQM